MPKTSAPNMTKHITTSQYGGPLPTHMPKPNMQSKTICPNILCYNQILIFSFRVVRLQYGQTYDSHTMTIWSRLDHELNLCNYLMNISCPRVLCPYWHPSTRVTPLLPSPSLFPPPLVRAVISPLLLPISSYPSLSLLISYPPYLANPLPLPLTSRSSSTPLAWGWGERRED